MKTKKTFDCVEMKNAIQARHRQEFEGLSDEEVRRRITERLATSDDVVARKWRAIVRAQQTTSLSGSGPRKET